MLDDLYGCQEKMLDTRFCMGYYGQGAFDHMFEEGI
jgi:hypothetical protein